MIIHPLKGVVVVLTSVEAALTEIKVGTHLTVEPRAFDRHHVAASAAEGIHEERKVMISQLLGLLGPELGLLGPELGLIGLKLGLLGLGLLQGC